MTEATLDTAPVTQRPPRRRRLISVGLVLGCVCLVAGCQALPWIGARAIVYPFRRANPVDPSSRGLAFETVTVPGADGLRLAGWWIPAEGASRGTVIYLHGHNDRRFRGLFYARELHDAGFAMLFVDLRAHGESEGSQLTYGWYERHDVVKMVDWALARAPDLPVGIIGESLGGAVAIQAAALDHRLAALVTVSTFADLPTTVAHYARRITGSLASAERVAEALRQAGELANFPPYQVRPMDAITSLQAATLIIHGDSDTWIPLENARQLLAASGAPVKELRTIPGANHHNVHSTSQDYLPGWVRGWFVEHLVRPGDSD